MFELVIEAIGIATYSTGGNFDLNSCLISNSGGLST